jgi:hypothetical protein
MTEPTPPTPPNPPTPPTPPTPPPAAWHDGVAPEVKGFWQLKGLPLDDPKAFGAKLTELYQQAEKFIGAPPDQIVRLPKADAKPEEFRAYHERLGAPKEAKDYDLSAVKEPAVADALRATMYEKGVPKDAAAGIAATIAKALESVAATQGVLDKGKLDEQRLNLEKNWGGKDSATYQFNHLNAMEGARRIGITPDAVKALEGQIGYDVVMEVMRKIGAHTREDTFVERGVSGQGDVTTMEGAVARKAELMADKEGWVKRYLAGGVAEKREMDRLNTMITGVAA